MAAPCVLPPEGLIAWWPGDDDARDLGIHGLHGELLPGTAFAEGKVGAAFRGLAEGTGIRITNAPALRPTHLSVAAWIQSSGPAGYAYVVAKSYGGTRASYALYTTSGGQLAFYVETTGPTGWARSGLAPKTLWDGQFHFVVGTYDGTRVRLYVDGAEVGTGEVASGAPRYRSDFFGGDLFIGTYEPVTTGEHPFEGRIDEVALWNRGLTSDEVRALWEAGGAGMCRPGCLPSPAGLVNWWSGDGHADDLIGGLSGRPQGTAGYGPGIVGQAFAFDGTGARVDVDRDAPEGSFTIEAWVRYTGEAWGKLGNGWSTILEFGIDQPTFGVRDTGELNFWPTLQGGYVPVNAWTHVAYTWDLAISRLYVNGAEVASTNLAPLTGGRGASLGWRTGDAAWLGFIDEVGIYERALEAGEIAAIHRAGSEGRCRPAAGDAPLITRQPANQVAIADVTFDVEATGRPPLTYQWYHEGAPVVGATNAQWGLPLEEIDPTDEGAYWVVVSNVFGVVRSTTANLTVPPDLTVVSVSAPATFLAGQLTLIDWAITNRGPGRAPGRWRLDVGLASDPEGTNAVILGSVSIPGPLDPGTALSGSVSVIPPAAEAGDRWVVIELDAADVIRELDESNNRWVASSPGIVGAPDLKPVRLVAPEAAAMGGTIEVTWAVTNLGSGGIPSAWKDRLYLTPPGGASRDRVRLLTVDAGRDPLPPGAGYGLRKVVTLPGDPAWVPGVYSISVVVDDSRSVAELDEGNNQLAVHLSLGLPDLPDLAVTRLEAPAAIRPGQGFDVIWAVTNAGRAEAVAPWTDSLVVSNATGERQILAEFRITNSLPALSGMVRTQRVSFPVDGAAGHLAMVLEADSGQVVWEEDEDNNTGSKASGLEVPVALTLRMPFERVTEGGAGAAFPGSVVRNGDRSAPLSVILTSSDPGELRVPGAVEIGAGRASAEFAMEAPSDGVVDGDQEITLGASAVGFEAANVIVRVMDVDRPRLALGPTNGVVLEGGTLEMSVDLGVVAGDAMGVSLVSAVPGRLRVPATITLPAGSRSVTFRAEAPEDGLVESTARVEVTATAAGTDAVTVVVEVQDDDLPVVTLALANRSVRENGGPAATLATLTREPVTPLEVTLALVSSDEAVAQVPVRVVIPAGVASIAVPVAVVDDAVMDGTREVLLGGYVLAAGSEVRVGEIRSERLEVVDDDGPALRVSVAPSLLREGLRTAASATIVRNSPTLEPLPIHLTSSDLTELVVPESTLIPAGSDRVTVTLEAQSDGVPDGSQRVTIMAAAAGHADGHAVVTVTDLDLPDLAMAVVRGPASAETDTYAEVAYRVVNEGFAPTATQFLTRVFLSRDPVLGDDLLVGQHPFTGVIPAGQYFEQSLQARIPSLAGEYWVFAETDVEGVEVEVLENNNVGVSSAPIRVTAAYGAWVATPVDQAVAGTSIPLAGGATNALGEPAPFKLVHLHLRVKGTERILAALTDDRGRFATVFEPLPGEAGLFQVFATHPGVADGPAQDAFSLLGLRSEPGSLVVKAAVDAPVAGMLELVNPGDATLTGLTGSWVDLPTGATADLRFEAPDVAGGGRVKVTYSMSAGAPAGETATRLEVATVEGVRLTVPVLVTVEDARPRLVVTSGDLVAGMARGRQTLVEVAIANLGGMDAGEASVSLPPVPWMRLATLEPLPALASGETNRLTLLLEPAPETDLGDYTGSLVIDAGAAVLNVPFLFRCLSEAKGDLRVEVEDEYTYFAEGSPRVAGARVTVWDAVGREVVQEGVTAVDGVFEVRGLQEGYYRVSVEAPDHDGFEVTRLFRAGETHQVSAFLRLQTVRYQWSVVPTGIEDRTRIVLETVFEASVPAPVVTVDPALIDLGGFTGDRTQVDLKITNHGLIAAEDVRLDMPTPPGWRFTPLINDLGTLPARSSLTIPMVIERVTSGGRMGLASFGEPAVGDCVVAGSVCGQYWCGQWIRFCQPVVLQRLRADCGSSGTMSFPELKFRGDWVITSSGTVSAGGGGGRGWSAPPNRVISPSSCQECIKVFAHVLADCPPEQIREHNAGWYLVYNLACRGEASPGMGAGLVLPEVLEQMRSKCPPPDSILRPPPLKCFTLALICPGWAEANSALARAGGETGWWDDRSPGGGSSWRRAGVLSPSGVEPAPASGLPARSRLVDQVPASLARQIPLVRTLAERLDRMEAGIDVWRVIFGDEVWIEAAGATNFTGWASRFMDSLEAGSEAGERIGDGERQSLLDVPPGGRVTAEHVERLVARCNRTADYNAAGIFSGTDLTPGLSPDFIARDALSNAVWVASQAIQTTHEQGYGDVLQAVNAAYGELLQLLLAPQGGGVCAEVRLRIEQQAVITREAFRASLEVENGRELPLEDVAVELAVRDASGRAINELFGVAAPTLENLSGADGTGVIPAKTTGVATWVLVPGHEAAPEVPVLCTVGGTLRYTQDGVRVTVPLTDVAITVHPSPRLVVRYFHQRDVLSDDPYTDVIEPAIPYDLAVMVENRGRGDARDVRIVSSQPKIVENEKGLLIDFQILATEVAGRGVVPSLTADFGTVTNGQIVIGRWLLTSTLQGLFTEYTATFEHLDGLGNPQLSLIESVTIHEMIRRVRAPGALDDGLPDFLVNELADARDLPDTLYLSDGRTNRVEVVANGVVDGAPGPTRRVATLTAAMPAGWGYVRVGDPGAGRYPLVRVIRSDGTELSVGTNVWTTDRTFPGLGRRPVREHLIHLLDLGGPGTYSLEYGEDAPSDLRAPESDVAGLAEASPAQFELRWFGDDEGGGSGLAYFDIYVAVDRGPFVPWLERTTRQGAIYTGNLGSHYAFYSVATDRAGNREAAPLAADAMTRVTLGNRAPVFAAPWEIEIDEGESVDLRVTAVDPDGATGGLRYSAGPGMPASASLDAVTGRFRWVTSEATGPVTHRFEIIASDDGYPPLTGTSLVQVVVREVNTAPRLEPVGARRVAEGGILMVTNSVMDLDLPANPLRFRLGPGAPAGAALDPVLGIFRWVPSAVQGPSTYTIEIVVNDGGQPPLEASRTFEVQVQDTRSDYGVRLGSTHVMAGEPGFVPLRLESSLDLRRLRFALQLSGGSLPDLALFQLSEEVQSAVLVPVVDGRSEVELALRSDTLAAGLRDLGRLRFGTAPNAPSAVVILDVIDLRAERSSDDAEPRGAARAGRVVVIGPEPVLTLDRNPDPELRLYGRPGSLYVIEGRSDWAGERSWQERQRVHLTDRSVVVDAGSGSEAMIFYRAYEATGGVLEIRRGMGSILSFDVWVPPGHVWDLLSTTSSPADGPWLPVLELAPAAEGRRTFDWTNRDKGGRYFKLRSR